MSFDPFSVATSSLALNSALPISGVDQVLFWLKTAPLSDHCRDDYRRAVEKFARLRDDPRNPFPLDARVVVRDLSKMGFDHREFRSVKAQDAWRRKVQASFRGACGELGAARERRARDDDWGALLAELKDKASSPLDGPIKTIHPQSIISLEVLADLARRLDLAPQDLTAERVRDLYVNVAAKDQKRSVLLASARLDELRDVTWGDLTAWLPRKPIGFEKPVLLSRQASLPCHLQAELETMVSVAARGKTDPTTGKTFGDLVPKPIYCAAKKVVATGLHLAPSADAEIESIAPFFDRLALTKILTTWRDWAEYEDPRALKASTAAGYFQRIKPFLKRNGYSAEAVSDLLQSSEWLQEGLDSLEEMTAGSQEFCERLLRHRATRLDFLSLHIRWQKEAMKQLELSQQTKGKVAGRHRERARALGMIAAFAAIETDGAPLRIDNALALTLGIPGAWLQMPTQYDCNARVHIPAKHTKNGKPIKAPIRAASQLRGLATLKWYVKTIRPLFPGSENSPYLFPSIQDATKSLSYNTFSNWWCPAVRAADLPGLNPHRFRHGQASILIARNPGNWDLATVRLGDKERTVKRNYAWIDTERLMEMGQDQLAAEFAA